MKRDAAALEAHADQLTPSERRSRRHRRSSVRSSSVDRRDMQPKRATKPKRAKPTGAIRRVYVMKGSSPPEKVVLELAGSTLVVERASKRTRTDHASAEAARVAF